MCPCKTLANAKEVLTRIWRRVTNIVFQNFDVVSHARSQEGFSIK
jgi:hypothetical protein